MVKYDLYRRPTGLLYRVRLDAPLWNHAECSNDGKRWIRSEYTVGGLLSSNNNTLITRNVAFKEPLC